MSRSLKVLKLLDEILIIERNVSNTDEIDAYIESIMLGNDKIDKWLKGNLRNFLINEHDKVHPVTKADKKSPPWLAAALERGDKIFNVDIDSEFKRKIAHVLDYFQSDDAPATLERIAVLDAIKKSNDWTKKLGRVKLEKEAPGGEKLFKQYPDGVKWVELMTTSALRKEGHESRMSHCVGGSTYCDKLEAGTSRFFSLRDKDDNPKATIEVVV